MGDAVDKMHELSIWGYVFGTHVFPFLKSSIASNIILVTIVGAIFWKVALALFDEDDSPVRALIFAIVGTALTQATLYNPVSFKLDEMAPMTASQLQEKQKMYGTDTGTMPWPSYYADKFMNGWIDLAMSIANPDNRFMFAGSPQAATAVTSRPEAVNDPQIRSALSQWQKVIAPSYLLTNPALMQKVQDAGLTDMLLYPGTVASDMGDAPLAVKARQLKDLLAAEPSLDLVGAVRSLSSHLNDPATRLNGRAFTLNADGTEVVAPTLSDYTLNSPVAPVTAPASWTPRAVKAYDVGRSVLSSIAQDPNRQPPSSVKDFAQLYEAIGNSVDVAVAHESLKSPENVLAFGSTCQLRGETVCKQAITNASTNMSGNSAQTLGGMWDNSTEVLKRFTAGVVTAPGAALDKFLLKFISTQVPIFIGAAKAIVTITTPVMLLVMLWPGRFGLGLTVLIGGYFLVGLWAVFYILWQWVAVDLMFQNNNLVLPDFQYYSVLVKIQATGLGALAVISWMIVFGGIEKAHRNMTPSGSSTGIAGVGKAAGAGVKVAGKSALSAAGKFLSKNP